MADDEVLQQLAGDLADAVMRAKLAGAPPADIIAGLADTFAQVLVAAQLLPARTLRLFDGVVTSAYARHVAKGLQDPGQAASAQVTSDLP